MVRAITKLVRPKSKRIIKTVRENDARKTNDKKPKEKK
jgi:hypothetical protein